MLVGFYMTVTAGLFGFLAREKVLWQVSEFSTLAFASVTLIGIWVGVLLSFYRAWHVLYIIQYTILQQLLYGAKKEEVRDLVKNATFRFNHFFSIELGTFLLVHVVVLLNFVGLWMVWPQHWHPWSKYTLVTFGLFELLMHFVGMSVLDVLKRRGTLPPQSLLYLEGMLSGTGFAGSSCQNQKIHD